MATIHDEFDSGSTDDDRLDGPAWTGLRQSVRSFRAALKRDECPEIASYLTGEVTGRLEVLAELVHEEMDHRRKRGESVDLDAYLTRFPELAVGIRTLSDFTAAESPLRRIEAAAEGAEAEGGERRDSRRRFGRYELEEVIGRGGFGIVYRARDEVLGRTVALKRLRYGDFPSPDSKDRFLREARAAAGLRHPNLVAVLDVGHVDDEPYLVTSLIEGRNLAQAMANERFGPRQAARWTATLAHALDFAHARGVIHRDVKPSNILIDVECEPHLVDFGLARDPLADRTLTAESRLIGTPAYMAPEQTRGRRKGDGPLTDERTDVYGLGVVLYELLTGTRPFEGTTPMLIHRIQTEDPRPPRQLDPAIPRDLETICLKAMAKEPSRRYRTAGGLAQDLRRFLDGAPIGARPVPGWERGTLWVRRHPTISGLSAFVVLLTAFGFAGVTWQWFRAETFRRRAEERMETLVKQQRKSMMALNEMGAMIRGLSYVLSDRSETVAVSLPEKKELRELLGQRYLRLTRPFESDPAYDRELAGIHFAMGVLSRVIASPSDELERFRKAQVLLEGITEAGRASAVDWYQLALCHNHQGALLEERGRLLEAREHCVLARDLLDRLSREGAAVTSGPSSSVQELKVRFSNHAILAGVERRLGLIEAAEASIERCKAAARAVVEATQGAPGNLFYYGRRMGRMLASHRPDEAKDLYRHACEIYAALPPDATLDPEDVSLAARCSFALATLLDRADQRTQAIQQFEKTISIYDRLLAKVPGRHKELVNLATCHHVLGRIHLDEGRAEEAVGPLRKSRAIRQRICVNDPSSSRFHSDLAGTCQRLGEALCALDRRPEAIETCREGMDHLRKLSSEELGEVEHRRLWSQQVHDQFQLRCRTATPAEAIALADEWAARWPDDPRLALRVAYELTKAAIRTRSAGMPLSVTILPHRRQFARAAVAMAWRGLVASIPIRPAGGKVGNRKSPLPQNLGR